MHQTEEMPNNACSFITWYTDYQFNMVAENGLTIAQTETTTFR